MNNPGSTPQHEMVVTSIAFSPEGNWFASADLTGKVLLWPGAAKQPDGELAPPYREVYGSDERRWKGQTRMVDARPVCFCGENMLVLPRFRSIGRSGQYRYATWGLQVAKLTMSNNRPQVVLQALPEEYFDMVTALAGSRDGRTLAAAEPRKVVLYQFTRNGSVRAPTQLPAQYDMVRGLSLSPDGTLLAVAATLRQGPAEAPRLVQRVELWNTSNSSQARLVWYEESEQPVAACSISPDAQRLAYASESQVHVAPIEQNDQPDAPVRRVVYSMPGVSPVDTLGFVESDAPQGAEKPVEYSLYVARGGNRRVFQLQRPDVVAIEEGERPPRLFAGAERFPNWALQVDGNRLKVTTKNLTIATLPLNPENYGEATCSYWIGEQAGRPRQLAVGFSNGAILVYALPSPDTPGGGLLRQFVGHQDRVTRLAVSPDGRYLASGGADGVAAIWPLNDLTAGAATDAAMVAWGVTVESSPNGRAVIKNIDARGPLFTSGVERGDAITALRVERQPGEQRVSGFEAIQRTLRELRPAVNQPVILAELQTAKGAERQVQVSPTWGPLLSLYSFADQWIAWTPNGYYESSLAGDGLLGWQLNHAVGDSPSFYTADQFLNQMWRPELIRRLLSEGSIKQAAAESKEGPVKQVELAKTPIVTVHAPEKSDAQTLDVTVQVQAADDVDVSEVLLEINGRPIQRDKVTRSGSFTLPFTLSADDQRFSDDKDLRLTATVRSSVGDGLTQEPQGVSWTSRRTAPPPDEATLYVLAIGVSDYQNIELEDGKVLAPLPKASVDAQRMAELLKQRHAYDAAQVTLLNTKERTTRAAIKESLRKLMQNPIDGNDTVVLYYAGHSIVEDDKNLVLISSDGLAGKLNAEDILREFCEGADGATRLGRRVVIFDSCHSGALVGIDMSKQSESEFSRLPERVAKRMKSQMWDTGLLL
ncbi:MAG: caspase family protein, partial [Planctomycetales bacterium]|nr:caspase family protein [Planctomycetales bacterium]